VKNPLFHYDRTYKFTIPWARTVKFAGATGTSLDGNKDILYMAVYNYSNNDVRFDTQVKLTYIDP